MTDLEYKAKLIERGNTKLAEYKDIQTFDSKINPFSNRRYKVILSQEIKLLALVRLGVSHRH